MSTRLRTGTPAAVPSALDSGIALDGAARPLALRLEGISVVLGGKRVVDRLDLSVGAGELLSILGPSGCGKTTTLRVIAGFVRPDAGRVLIDGQDVASLGPERRPTAMVFQNYALWPHMSVLKNLTFGLRAQGAARAEANARAREALELVGLAEAAARAPVNLSGGEQQRVALARALVLRPSLLLLDEPLSNLDAQLRVRVRDELVELQRRTGVSMILVTHDQDEALSVSDRVAVMHGGRLEQVDRPPALYREPATTFVAGFVGRVNQLPVVLDERSGAVRLARVSPGGEPGELVAELARISGMAAPTGSGALSALVRPEDVGLEPALGGDGSVSQPGRGAGLEGSVVRVVSRGHFDEVVVDSAIGTIRSYRPPGSIKGPVLISLRRVLLYDGNDLLAIVEPGGAP